MKQKNSMRKNILLRRIAALLCALSIPVMYILAIVLMISENPYGRLFLAIFMGMSMVLLSIMYLATKFPKDMGEIYGNMLDMVEKEKHR